MALSIIGSGLRGSSPQPDADPVTRAGLKPLPKLSVPVSLPERGNSVFGPVVTTPKNSLSDTSGQPSPEQQRAEADRFRMIRVKAAEQGQNTSANPANSAQPRFVPRVQRVTILKHRTDTRTTVGGSQASRHDERSHDNQSTEQSESKSNDNNSFWRKFFGCCVTLPDKK